MSGWKKTITLSEMEITAYTSKGCFYCDQLKKLLERAELDAEYILLDTDEKRNHFHNKYPACQGYPYVIIDGVEYGGIVNVAKFLIKEGLVSAEKK